MGPCFPLRPVEYPALCERQRASGELSTGPRTVFTVSANAIAPRLLPPLFRHGGQRM